MSRPIRLSDLDRETAKKVKAAMRGQRVAQTAYLPRNIAAVMANDTIYVAPKPAPALVLEDYRGWIRSHPCGVCCETKHGVPIPCGSECVHVGGRRRHGDVENLVPMDHAHHRELHQMGIGSFQRKYKINLRRMARTYWRNYRREDPTYAF